MSSHDPKKYKITVRLKAQQRTFNLGEVLGYGDIDAVIKIQLRYRNMFKHLHPGDYKITAKEIT